MKSRARWYAALAALVLVVLAGCVSPHDPRTAPLADVAAYYPSLRVSAYQKTAEEHLLIIQERAGFTDQEIARIRAADVRIGDPALLVLAAWGRPMHINTTTVRRGTSAQWCYEGVYGYRYVYIERGVVTAIQRGG